MYGVKSLPVGGHTEHFGSTLVVGFEGQVNNAGEIITSRRNMNADDEITLKCNLLSVPDNVRPKPTMFHAITGHVLPAENTNVYKQMFSVICLLLCLQQL